MGLAMGTVRPSLSTRVSDGGIPVAGVGPGWDPAAWCSRDNPGERGRLWLGLFPSLTPPLRKL